KNVKATRRQLLQSTALAAGAAALVTKPAAAQPPQPAQQPAVAPVVIEDFGLWKKLYPGFRNERIKTTGAGGAEINAIIGGSGPPLLLVHGAPDSLITWRLIAADLAKEYTLVLMDLRGYGDSSKPEGEKDHSTYSKRPMALDGVEVMKHFGFNQFRYVGHDRGGRVGWRMAMDHPDKVQKIAVLDIVPAHYLYSHVTEAFVNGYYHWFSYLRPAPAPENELKAANEAAAARATDEIQKEYARNRVKPEAIHAM